MKVLKSKVFKKGGKQRFGRGFSLEELKKAELSLKKALKLGVPVDSRRRTVHEENVEAIKRFLQSQTANSRRKAKPKS